MGIDFFSSDDFAARSHLDIIQPSPDEEREFLSRLLKDNIAQVAVLDGSNKVVSVVNVSVLLKKWKHDHPHDAILLPSGDMIVATWDPGRLSYWKKL